MEYSERIIQTANKMVKLGLVKGTWGNISLRKGNKIYITPSGVEYDKLTNQDVAVIDIESGKQIGGHSKPSSELPLHMEIYKAFSSINGVVHTHSIYATVYASMNRKIPCYVEDQAQIIGGDIEVANYAFPGSEELGKNVVQTLQNGNFGVLMARHGAVGIGRSLDEAMIAAQIIEKSAKIAFLIEMAKGEDFIPKDDIKKMRKIYLEKYSSNIIQ